MALYHRDFDINAPPFHFRWKSASSMRWTTSKTSMPWIFLVLLIIIHPQLFAAHNPATSCLSIQVNCVQRRGCATALHHYLLSCAYLINGQTTDDDDDNDHQCSVRCQRALVTLVSATTEEPPTRNQRTIWPPSTTQPPTQHHYDHHGGWPPLPSFMSCSCGGNDLCRSQRSRLDCCLDGVTTALRAIADQETSVSCSLAEQICRADTSCLTAIEFYGRNCAYLLHQAGGGGTVGGGNVSGGSVGGGSGGGDGAGERCLARCRNSVRVLYRQRQATKLRSCECDGTEDYDCRTLQSRTQQLCVDGERISRGSKKRLTPRQKLKQLHRNMTTFHMEASPDFTSEVIPLPPPRKRHGSANSGSKSVARGIQNETLLICLLLLLGGL